MMLSDQTSFQISSLWSGHQNHYDHIDKNTQHQNNYDQDQNLAARRAGSSPTSQKVIIAPLPFTLTCSSSLWPWWSSWFSSSWWSTSSLLYPRPRPSPQANIQSITINIIKYPRPPPSPRADIHPIGPASPCSCHCSGFSGAALIMRKVSNNCISMMVYVRIIQKYILPNKK